MLILVCIATALTCAVGWFICWATEAALVKYMKNKGYTPPSDNEIKACIREVMQEKFGSKKL